MDSPRHRPRPDVTLVIPAANERRRIGASLAAVQAYLAQQRYRAEVVIVDDGSHDGTSEVVYRAVRRFPDSVTMRVLRHARNLGKGAAVRSGMLAARGRFVVYMDADLAVPIEETERVLQALLDGCDIAVGTRVQPDGRDMRAGQPAARRAAGRTFTAVRRVIATRDILDTQCPLKAFRAETIGPLFRRQRVRGWAFDAEILLLARQHGYRVCQVPVVWHHQEGSNLRPGVRLAARVTWDLARMRTLHLGGR